MLSLRCVFGAYLGGTPPNLQRFLVDTDVYFASQAALSATMLACVPLAFTLSLDAGAINRRFRGPFDPR